MNTRQLYLLLANVIQHRDAILTWLHKQHAACMHDMLHKAGWYKHDNTTRWIIPAIASLDIAAAYCCCCCIIANCCNWNQPTSSTI